jgi:hypothetical protein
MALKLIGDVSGYEADVSADKALYVESRGPARGTYGAFSYGFVSNVCDGNMTNTSNVFSIVWTAPVGVCLIYRLRVGLQNSPTTPYTGASPVQMDVAVYFARGFTTLPPNSVSLRVPSMGPNMFKLVPKSVASRVGFLCVTSSDDMGGSYSADSQPLARQSGWLGTTAGFQVNGGPLVPLVDRTGYGQYPVVLAQNEGLIVTNPAMVNGSPATGGWEYAVNIDWVEALSY